MEGEEATEVGVANPGITVGIWSSGAGFCTSGRGWNTKTSTVAGEEDLWPMVSITVHPSHCSAPILCLTQLCFSRFLVGHNFWCEPKKIISRTTSYKHCRCSQGCNSVILTQPRVILSQRHWAVSRHFQFLAKHISQVPQSCGT